MVRTINDETVIAAGPARAPGRNGRHRVPTAAGVTYLVLAVVLFSSAWRYPAWRNIGDSGDPLSVMWALRWTPYALSHGHNPFFTNHVNFPAGVNLMWNSPMVVFGVLLWPVTAWLGPTVAYNTLMTLNVALSAWAGFFAIRMVVHDQRAAAVGGLLYGFSPYMIAHSSGHPNLTAAFMPPLLALLLADVLVHQRRPPRRAGVLLGLFAVTQLFIAEEMLASEVLAGAVVLIVLCARNRSEVSRRAPHAVRAAAWALAVFAALASGPLLFQFLGPQGLHGDIQPSNFFVTDLANVVVPTAAMQFVTPRAIAATHRWSANLAEWNGYLGLPLLVLLAYVGRRFRALPAVKVAATAGLTLAILSLGPNLHVNGVDTRLPLPWRAVSVLPAVGHMLPARLMLYVFGIAALLVSIFLDHALRRGAAGPAAAGLALALAPLVPAFPYRSEPVARTRFFTSAAASEIPEGSVALIAPYQTMLPVEPMLWQAEAGFRFRMPQGYVIVPGPGGRPRYGAPPSTISDTLLAIQNDAPFTATPALRDRLLRDLADRQVDTVVVGPMRHQRAMLDLFGDLFQRPPAHVEDVYLWRDLRSGA